MSSLDRSVRPLKDLTSQQLKNLRGVFFDIDDTFSTHGKIRAEAYDALWALQLAGFVTVPITGRPAGWCDLIARMWPVHAVVGENGAFFVRLKKGKLVKVYLESESVRKHNAKRLLGLRAGLLRKFKGLCFASDQGFREFDLAIDYCEDVKPWSQRKIQDVMAYCAEKGAQVKLSSIHINTWFGRYDKWSCVRRVIKEFKDEFAIAVPSETESIDLHRIAYLGDSPNDEPFFEKLPLSIGVANVRKFLPTMKYPPRYVAEHEGGAGFAEFARMLLAVR